MMKCLWNWRLNLLKRIWNDSTRAPEDSIRIASHGINIPVWSCNAESCAWQMARRWNAAPPTPWMHRLLKQQLLCPLCFHFQQAPSPERNVSVLPLRKSPSCRSEDVLEGSQDEFCAGRKQTQGSKSPSPLPDLCPFPTSVPSALACSVSCSHQAHGRKSAEGLQVRWRCCVPAQCPSGPCNVSHVYACGSRDVQQVKIFCCP